MQLLVVNILQILKMFKPLQNMFYDIELSETIRQKQKALQKKMSWKACFRNDEFIVPTKKPLLYDLAKVFCF